jgi:hypothetical protein
MVRDHFPARPRPLRVADPRRTAEVVRGAGRERVAGRLMLDHTSG